MDRDGSGAVSYDELKQLLGRFNIHMSDAQFNEMILKIDENSDGEITRSANSISRSGRDA